MYDNSLYKILLSCFLLVYLYVTSYNLIIVNKKSYNVTMLIFINIISIAMLILSYRVYEADSSYIQDQSFKVFFLLEQISIGAVYLFMLNLCKPYLKIDWQYRIYIFILPIIVSIAMFFNTLNVNSTSDVFFADYNIFTGFIYGTSIIYISVFYSLCVTLLIIKLLLEKITVTKSYTTYYISFLVLFLSQIIYEFYLVADILRDTDLIFFQSTIVIFINLITFKYVNEANLALSREHVFNKLSTAYVMVDNNFNIIDYNTNFYDNFLMFVSKLDQSNLNNVLGNFKFEKLKEYENNFILVKNIEHFNHYYVMKDTTLNDQEHTPIGKIVEFIEITEKVELIKKQDELLNIDELTGLYSRRYYYDIVETFNKKEFLPLCFFSLDVNNLKLINDTYGHKFGDKYLIRNSKAVKQLLPHNAVIARLGGDEIVAVIPNCKDNVARNILERIKAKNKEVAIKPYDVVDISVGYALKSDLNQNSEDILAIADENMYENKIKTKKGRG